MKIEQQELCVASKDIVGENGEISTPGEEGEQTSSPPDINQEIAKDLES